MGGKLSRREKCSGGIGPTLVTQKKNCVEMPPGVYPLVRYGQEYGLVPVFKLSLRGNLRGGGSPRVLSHWIVANSGERKHASPWREINNCQISIPRWCYISKDAGNRSGQVTCRSRGSRHCLSVIQLTRTSSVWYKIRWVCIVCHYHCMASMTRHVGRTHRPRKHGVRGQMTPLFLGSGYSPCTYSLRTYPSLFARCSTFIPFHHHPPKYKIKRSTGLAVLKHSCQQHTELSTLDDVGGAIWFFFRYGQYNRKTTRGKITPPPGGRKIVRAGECPG